MRKMFALTSPKLNPDRHVEAIKHQIKKYLARERRKTLPDGKDYWYFDCKIGPTESDARSIREAEIKPMIDELVAEQHKEFYLEIQAKAGVKSKPEKLPETKKT